MEDDAAQRVEAKLDVIIRLLAAPMMERKSVKEKVEALLGLGLTTAEIASICNTSPDAVRARRSEAKRGRKASERGGRTAGESK
jgi:DNA-directed RNA polymerase specialized sigma24 family protein